MRSFVNFCLWMYIMNFAFGYIAVRRARPERFCRQELGQAKGWELGAVILLMPGEANACLDLELWRPQGERR